MDIKNSGQKRLMKSGFWESFSKTHIAVPLTIFYGLSLIISIYCAIQYQVPVSTVLLVFAFGFFVFTFIEYLVHRYVFHMGTYTRIREKIQYLFHGVHHEYPRDKERLAMPPLASVSIAVVLFVFFWLVAGTLGWVFGSGFIAGYAFYLSMHYAVHAFRPPKNFMRIMWRYHSIHHYKNHEVAYGVSSPFWDMVFRTLPD